MKILVVEGVATGASAAARLRRLNEDAEIIVFEKGQYVSFSNCGLPYRFSGTIDQTNKLVLMSPDKLNAQYNLDVRVMSEVIKIDTEKQRVTVINHLTKKEYTETYDKLVVSPGAEAIVPSFAGLDLIDNFTLKTVPDVAKIMQMLETKDVKHLTVVGGGFIGVEAAENLREAGYEVTLIEGSEQILAPFDFEMSLLADLEMHKHGIEIIKNDLVDSFKEKTIILKSGRKITSDAVILSIGVRPDTRFMTDSKINLDERGFIKVNESYQTSDANVYAGGDAILVKNQLTQQVHSLALAGPANKQGRLIADHISGKKVINNGYIGSSIIKVFDLTLAATGLNEKALANTSYNYEVAIAAPTDRVGLMPGVAGVMSKLIFDADTGQILGAQAVSTGVADKRIDIIATAIKGKMTIYDLYDLELCYAPPFGTGKDVVNKLGYIATNLFEENFKQISFTKVYDLVKEGVQIIDVREANEYANLHVQGVKNIPMSEFRNRLNEFDRTKPVYVHCQTGQRSYNVALALQAYGFDVTNIAGSFLFIKNYEQAMQLEDANRQNILVK